MNLRYIINFKFFGYSHPFRRKRQTKVKFREQTCLFHVELFSMLLCPLCFMCTRFFYFVLHFLSQNLLIAAPMHSGRLSSGRIMQLHLFKVSKSSKRLQKIKKLGAHKIWVKMRIPNMEYIECYVFHVLVWLAFWLVPFFSPLNQVLCT